jgi:Flp pilus assembly protein TadG
MSRPRRRTESGQAMVEFTLVLPLLLLILLGMLDFGKAFNYWIDETHLASQGARLAAVNAPTSVTGGVSLVQYIQQQADTSELKNGGTAAVPQRAKVCVSFPNGTANVGDPVQVSVSVSYNWLPFITNRIGGATSTTITGSSVMRLEAKPSFGAGCY